MSFPLEVPLGSGFVAERPETWPLVDGQLEVVAGKLLYMPPCADKQQDTTADVITVLGIWRRAHREFVVAGNEAGMMLGGDARGADAAVWRRDAVGPYEGKYGRVPPILAVEVQGEVEDEAILRKKARWYLENGVRVVWLLSPSELRVLVLEQSGERSLHLGDRIPPCAELPDFEPEVAALFEQIA